MANQVQRWLIPVISRTLEIWGREMTIDETCDKVAKTTFEHLCGSPRSSADYLALSEKFEVIIIEGIPKMSLETRNEARRFITLIDSLYDCKVIY